MQAEQSPADILTQIFLVPADVTIENRFNDNEESSQAFCHPGCNGICG